MVSLFIFICQTLSISSFVLSGPDGKEKWAMGLIPSLYKNVLLGLIPKKWNRFVMGLSVWTFIWSGPDGKEKLAMGSIPSLKKM